MSARQIAYATTYRCPWEIFHMAIHPGRSASGAAAAIGRAVVRRLGASEIDAVMVFGGDTAFGILKALGCPPLEPVGEVVTGVAVSRVAGRNLTLITKAGGFGDERLIGRVQDALHGNQ
jgi:uncharacterized protein YgbK (DUF1537 family)